MVRWLPFSLLVGLAALVVLGCGPSDAQPDQHQRADPGVIAPATSRPDDVDSFLQLPDDVPPIDFPWSEVVIERSATNLADLVVGVLVADTPDRRTRGMMYRNGLPAGSGMLFVWSDAIPRTGGFWNPNVPIDLDVAWLDTGGVIREFTVLIAQDETVKRPAAPYVSVMEMPRGRFDELAIALGDRVIIPPTLRP